MRSTLLILLLLACGHAAVPADSADDPANELLRVACDRTLARLAPDAAGARRMPLALPAELSPALSALRGTGMGDRVDAFEAALERAARLALQATRPWLEETVAGFAPADAEALLSGPDDALSTAFQGAHEADLRAQLDVESQRVLEEAGTVAALSAVRDGSQRLPLRRDVDVDLVSLVTKQALHDFFEELREQETGLRREQRAGLDGYGAGSNPGPLTGSEEQGESR